MPKKNVRYYIFKEKLVLIAFFKDSLCTTFINNSFCLAYFKFSIIENRPTPHIFALIFRYIDQIKYKKTIFFYFFFITLANFVATYLFKIVWSNPLILVKYTLSFASITKLVQMQLSSFTLN